jgi:hypothetical protein
MTLTKLPHCTRKAIEIDDSMARKETFSFGISHFMTSVEAIMKITINMCHAAQKV